MGEFGELIPKRGRSVAFSSINAGNLGQSNDIDWWKG